MGFSSFMTADTDKDIWNDYTENPTKVKILTPHGYIMEGVTNDGYMRFGGKDYFEMVAELNGYVASDENDEYLRDTGLHLFYNDIDSCEFPKVVSMEFDGEYTDLPHQNEWCAGGRQGYWDE